MLLLKYIKYIEDNIYSNISIYRSIFVTDNKYTSDKLKIELDCKNYNSIIINTLSKNINYNEIDSRIVIITEDLLINFIKYLDKYCDGILNSTFNFIAFYPNINNNNTLKFIDFYMKITNNNNNNTIILDLNYAKQLFINKICK